MTKLQKKRLVYRSAFFILFVMAPPLDILRLDLNQVHLVFFTQIWSLGLDPLIAAEIDAGQAAVNLILRGFLPIAGVIGLLGVVSWRYGRLYCGWLCPHFSVVEVINALMRRASGRPTLWESEPLPERLPDGRLLHAKNTYWVMVAVAVIGFAFLWSLTLLTYLLPPQQIYSNLMALSLSRNQALFLSVATLIFALEFLLARHLFCRFGCAVGVFQSIVWMTNKHAMVVGFDRSRSQSCASCNTACENACPMRLRPRAIKRKMFTCTQCAECLNACTQVQTDHPQGSLLHWLESDCALDVSNRDFGRRPQTPEDCFKVRLPSRTPNAIPKYKPHPR